MRILIIGFIVFVSWSALSTYLYVCKIKKLCDQPQTAFVEEVNQNKIPASEPKEEEKAVIPKDLVIYFAFDKSDFISGAEANIYFNKANAYILHNTQAKLNITGHTDAIGSLEYNHALGLRRAQSMQKYIESKGIPKSRIKIESKGEKEPVADNRSDEGRANNRRTVVTIK